MTITSYSNQEIQHILNDLTLFVATQNTQVPTHDIQEKCLILANITTERKRTLSLVVEDKNKITYRIPSNNEDILTPQKGDISSVRDVEKIISSYLLTKSDYDRFQKKRCEHLNKQRETKNEKCSLLFKRAVVAVTFFAIGFFTRKLMLNDSTADLEL